MRRIVGTVCTLVPVMRARYRTTVAGSQQTRAGSLGHFDSVLPVFDNCAYHQLAVVQAAYKTWMHIAHACLSSWPFDGPPAAKSLISGWALARHTGPDQWRPPIRRTSPTRRASPPRGSATSTRSQRRPLPLGRQRRTALARHQM